MSARPRVVIAMSGGVDSSVAAALLKQQGYDVIGMMLRLWNEPGAEADNRCCTPDAMATARRVAAMLDIRFYALDAQDVFYNQVVTPFFKSYLAGDTPNPCVSCNRHIRWEFLLERARAVGAEYLATGHYARLRPAEAGMVELLKGLDPAKDQSYVLHVLTQAKLRQAMFPLGEYTKPQVRALARQFNLPAAERAESQDLCFLGASDYRSFLERHAPQARQAGPIYDRAGIQLGEHQGLAFYTIGQRKGLGIAHPEPLYVLAKDAARNALIVGRAEELGHTGLLAGQVNWPRGAAPTEPIPATVKIRYKAAEAPAMVTPLAGGQASVRFDQPVRGITPGQAAVFYQGEVVLGGGTILHAENW